MANRCCVETIYKQVMTLPNDDEMYRRMFDAWNVGEHAFALELSRDLLRQFPDYGTGWLLQGVMLYELARYDESEKTLRLALQLIPKQALDHGYIHLGHLCKDRGDYEDAECFYRKALELAPDDAGRHIFLGAVLAKKGDFDSAEKAHRNAICCAKGDIDEAYLNLGYVLRAQERYSEALGCFTKALGMTPNYEEAVLAKQDMEKVLQYMANKS